MPVVLFCRGRCIQNEPIVEPYVQNIIGEILAVYLTVVHSTTSLTRQQPPPCPNHGHQVVHRVDMAYLRYLCIVPPVVEGQQNCFPMSPLFEHAVSKAMHFLHFCVGIPACDVSSIAPDEQGHPLEVCVAHPGSAPSHRATPQSIRSCTTGARTPDSRRFWRLATWMSQYPARALGSTVTSGNGDGTVYRTERAQYVGYVVSVSMPLVVVNLRMLRQDPRRSCDSTHNHPRFRSPQYRTFDAASTIGYGRTPRQRWCGPCGGFDCSEAIQKNATGEAAGLAGHAPEPHQSDLIHRKHHADGEPTDPVNCGGLRFGSHVSTICLNASAETHRR